MDIAWAAFVGWCASIGFFAATVALAAAQPAMARRRARPGEARPVTVVVPLSRMDHDLAPATASAFEADIPGIEVLVGTATPESLAAGAVNAVAGAHPGVPFALVTAPPAGAVSPKVDNLVACFAAARNDTVLVKDANVRLEPGQAAELLAAFHSDAGMVVAAPLIRDPEGAAGWLEHAIVGAHQTRMLMAAAALGRGYGIGKLMLFRLSDLERAGGAAAIRDTVAEDHAMGRAIQGLGRRIELAPSPAGHRLGPRRLEEVWRRQRRWAMCRRLSEPALFAVEPLAGIAPALAAGALAAPALGLGWPAAAVATLAIWCAGELALARIHGWDRSPWWPLLVLGREGLMLAVWLRTWTTGQVSWDGAPFDAVRRGGRPSG